MVISIKEAKYIEGYKIKFSFSDGIEKLVDFENFLTNAKNPMTQKYLDKVCFRDFSLSHGDIQWNDYELCFPIWDIYEGRI